jgi:hypothetical protein
MRREGRTDDAGEGGRGNDQRFPAEDPNAVTAEMLQALQDVWTKAGYALLTRALLCAQAALELPGEFNQRDVQAGEQPVNRLQRGTG